MAERSGGDRERPGLAALLGSISQRSSVAIPPDEGLRERKKRETRQHISDTATDMFLERGFEAVRVAEVAAACGVSEKTVYNYFPTKESLLFDREDDLTRRIRDALGRREPGVSPIQAAVAVLVEDVTQIYGYWMDTAHHGFEVSGIQRFGELVESTSSLRAAQRDMMERLVQVAAEAMASQAGVDPDGPEPQIAADAIIGLWRIQWRSMRRYSDGSRTAEQVRDLVIDEIRRAARLIDTGLWSFSVAVQGASTRQQVRDAAEAANEARKQVVTALRQARDAWRLAMTEAQAHVRHEDGHDPGLRKLHKEQHAEQQKLRARQKKRERARSEANRARGRGPGGGPDRPRTRGG